MSAASVRFSCFMALVGLSLATVALGPSPVHPDHPGQCWSESQKKSYPDGKNWQEPNCVQVTCTAYKDKLYVQYASCPSVGVPPGCTTTRDLKLPYPSCCPMPSCPDELPTAAELNGPEYEDFTNWINEHYDQQTQME
ncbi:U-scoloptoxin(16)-Er12a-like [Palaemon carinicauda]|uniref:U-scoloptoxin(16)-Er12a-like n=1 Tax=Palaemon carinicauda TaxID=392227 RepID=UPI0035B627E0